MKVENAAIDSGAATLYSGKVTQASRDEKAESVVSRKGSDQISLSGASDLVSAAKNLVPADKLSKVETIRAMVNAGTYKAEAVSTSHALINAHIES